MTIGRSGNPAATSCRASWFGGAMSRSRGVGAAFDCRLGYPDASLALKLPRTRADWFGVREADAICGTTTPGGANNGGTVFEIAQTATRYASTPTVLVSFNSTT